MLNKELVKEFIEKNKKCIFCKITILNLDGEILGNSNERVLKGSIKNAMKAMKKQICIETRRMNVLEMISPFYYKEKVIGALICTGNEKYIKDYFEFLLNNVELIIEQRSKIIRSFISDKEEHKIKNNSIVDLILKESMGDELLNTFLIYINRNGERNIIAKELHIHRNTLNYRLNKIEEITGLRFNNYIDLKEYVNAYIKYFEKS